MPCLRGISVFNVCNLMQVLPATIWTSALDNLLLAAGAAPDAVHLLRLCWQRSVIGREACKFIAQPLCAALAGL